MTAITFDTLKFANRLKAAGAEPKLAEAEAEALAEVFEVGAQELATKADLREMEGGFKTEIHQLRHEMREVELKIEARMAENKADLIRWVVGVGILQLTFIAALLLKLLPS